MIHNITNSIKTFFKLIEEKKEHKYPRTDTLQELFLTQFSLYLQRGWNVVEHGASWIHLTFLFYLDLNFHFQSQNNIFSILLAFVFSSKVFNFVDDLTV